MRPIPKMPRSYLGACAAVAVVVALGALWIGANGVWGWAPPRYTTDFHDEQARALLAGHIDVSPDVAGPEGWDMPNGTQFYPGVLPALVRLPLFALMPIREGVAGRYIVAGAALLTMMGAARLLWTARAIRVGPDPPDRAALVVGALWVLSVGAGSVLLPLTINPLSWHESALWGVAFAVLASDSLIRFLWQPAVRPLVATAAFAGAATMSRANVGAGFVVGLTVVAASSLYLVLIGTRTPVGPVPWLLGRPATAWVQHRRRMLLCLALVPLAVAGYCSVNQARFGHPVRIPWEKQHAYAEDAGSRALLEQNGNSYFQAATLPSNVLSFFRPDGVRFRSSFPYVTYLETPQIIEFPGTTYEIALETSSLTTTSPLLLLLAAAGVVALRRSAGAIAAPFRLPLLCTVLTAGTVLIFTCLSYRYVADLLPTTILLGAIALASPRAQRPNRLQWIGAAVMITWAAWVNVSFGLITQRVALPRDATDAAAWNRQSASIDVRLGTGPAIIEATAPPPDSVTTRWATPGCRRLYLSSGAFWVAVERRPGPDVVEVRATPSQDLAARSLVLRSRDGQEQYALRRSAWGVTLDRSVDGGASWSSAGLGKGVPGLRDEPVDVLVDEDQDLGRTTVLIGGRLVYVIGPRTPRFFEPAGGAAPVDPPTDPTPVCDAWRARSGR